MQPSRVAERARASVRLALARFWVAVDTTSITLFQVVFGTAFILCGINGIFLADREPPITLRGTMGSIYIDLWYALLILGPLVCAVGKVLSHRLTYAGQMLQFTGDVTVAMALLAYISGTIRTEPIGHGGFGAFGATALFISAVLFITRDVRQLWIVEKGK